MPQPSLKVFGHFKFFSCLRWLWDAEKGLWTPSAKGLLVFLVYMFLFSFCKGILLIFFFFLKFFMCVFFLVKFLWQSLLVLLWMIIWCFFVHISFGMLQYIWSHSAAYLIEKLVCFVFSWPFLSTCFYSELAGRLKRIQKVYLVDAFLDTWANSQNNSL